MNNAPDLQLPMSFAMSNIVSLTITVVCIAVAWWCLQSFRFDVFLRNPKGAQAKALQVMLSVVLGYEAAQFLFYYTGLSVSLRWLM